MVSLKNLNNQPVFIDLFLHSMKTHFFFLLLIIISTLATIPLQAQESNEIDSLLKLLPGIPNDTNKIKKYARLGWLYGETNSQTDIVKKYADSIRMLSQDLKYEKGIALSHFYYGFNDRHSGNYDDALRHLNTFIQYFSHVGDSNNVANGLFQIGAIHSYRGNYDQSLSLSLRILKIYQFKKKPYGVATTLHSIGIAYFNTEKYDKAIDCFNRSIQILDSLESGKPTQAIGVNYSSLGSVYLNKGAYDTARKYFDQSLKISRQLGNDWGTANELENLGYISSQLEKYDEALRYYLNSLSIREQLAQKRELALSLSNVGYTYLKLKDYPAAQRYLLKSLAMAREIGSKPLIYDIYKDLADLMAGKKDFDQAYEYHRQYASMKDSVLNEESTRQLQELQAKYEAGEKDKQIMLLAKEREIQQKEVERQATLKKVLIGGLALAILLIGLSLYVFLQRLRNQKQLALKDNKIKEANFKHQVSELQMKALRAQINPHFLFNCMNAINLMIQKGETECASSYLTKFSKLVRVILENAEVATVTLESEMGLLESYIQLEELRLPGKLGYTISVDKSIGMQSTYMPSMVLQPVVENAIWHGIVHKENDAKGNISIDVRQNNDQLLCTIEDNGVGRDRAQQLRDKSLLKNKSMGMKITEERLRLRSRKHMDQCIEITDLKDTLNHATGTRVIVHIPISEQDD